MTTSRNPQDRRRGGAHARPRQLRPVAAAGALLLPMLLGIGVSSSAGADEPSPVVPPVAASEPTARPSESRSAELEPGATSTPSPEPSAAAEAATPSPESPPSASDAEPTATPDPVPTATPTPAVTPYAAAASQPTAAGSRPVARAAAAAGPRLGTAGNFAILAGSTITNTGRSVIAGDVGLHPGTAVTGFDSCTGPANCVVLTGTMHVTDGVARQAKADLLTAYDTLVGLEETCTPLVVELGGARLTPGVYCSPTFELTGTLTLSGVGEFVFLTGAGGSTLTTAAGSRVLLVDGADSCGVYWQVASSAVIGAASAFAGNILADTAISFGAGATLDGSALARGAAVTLIANTITDPRCAGDGGGSPGGGGGATPSASVAPVPSRAGVLPARGVTEGAASSAPVTARDFGGRDAPVGGGLPATGTPVALHLLLGALALGLGAPLVVLSRPPGRHRFRAA